LNDASEDYLLVFIVLASLAISRQEMRSV